MTRAEAWVKFATAVLYGGEKTPEQAGEWADMLLGEASKRFPELQEKCPKTFGDTLSFRAWAVLEEMGIKDDDALAALTEKDLDRIRGIGIVTRHELKVYLHNVGKTFS